MIRKQQIGQILPKPRDEKNNGAKRKHHSHVSEIVNVPVIVCALVPLLQAISKLNGQTSTRGTISPCSQSLHAAASAQTAKTCDTIVTAITQTGKLLQLREITYVTHVISSYVDAESGCYDEQRGHKCNCNVEQWPGLVGSSSINSISATTTFPQPVTRQELESLFPALPESEEVSSTDRH